MLQISTKSVDQGFQHPDYSRRAIGTLQGFLARQFLLCAGKFIKAIRSASECCVLARRQLADCKSAVNVCVSSRRYGASISGHGDQKNLRLGCAVEFSSCRTEVARPILIHVQDYYL